MKKIYTLVLTLFSLILFAQEQVKPELLENMRFRNIGPAGMSGRISSIDVDPFNDQKIYAGSSAGGLWLSENGGQSWTCIFNNEKVASIGVVKIDPSNSSIIWVGTGEGNPRNSQTSGYGIYKSVDGGRNWQLMGLEKTRNIHRILVDPRNSNVVYVGAIGVAWGEGEDRGVYKSTDGGKTWSKTLYVDEKTGAADLVMDPANPDKIIAAMWEYRRWPWFFNSGGPSSGLYITHNGGETWEKRTDKDGLPKGDLGRIGVAISPSQPKIIYALVENEAKNALYKSTDGGFKWNRISDDNQIGNRPFYYSELYVDPVNPNRIYSLWSILTMSEDGGKTWDNIAPYSSVHPDHHAFWVGKDPNYIIEGNDGGLNISRDGGQNWRFVENLPLAQFYHIRVDDDLPYNVYGGMQDNGSWRGPAYVWHAGGIRNSDWRELFFGDGFDVMPDPENNRYVYAQSQEGFVAYVDTETGYSRSVRPVSPDSTVLRFNWNAAIAQDPFDAATIYFGSQFVHKSTNRGAAWQIISPDLTTNDTAYQKQLESGGLTFDVTGAENYTTIISIAPSSLEKDVLWVGTDDGKVQITKDGGKSWNNVADNLKGVPTGAWVAQITPSEINPGEAFVVVNDYRRNNWKPYLYHTTNYGKSFTSLVSEENVWGYTMSVLQDPEEENLLFLGTEYGLYFSLDKGKNWQQWGKDFPTVQVADLAIQKREADLIVGTFGCAAWVLDDIRPLRALAANKEDVLSQPISVFSAPTAYDVEWLQADGMRFAADAVYAGDNRTAQARICFWLNKDENDTALKKVEQLKIEIFNNKKELIRTLYTKYNNGLNRTYWDLCAKGGRYPSMREPRKSKYLDDPSGETVLPGEYLVKIWYGKNVDSTKVEVKFDPRINISETDLAEHRAFMVGVLKDFDAIEKVAENLRSAKKEIGFIDEQLKDKKGKEWKEAKEKVTAIKDSLEKVRLAIWGKEDVKGYYEQPDTWMGLAGNATWLLSGNHGKVGDNEKLLAKKIALKTDETLKMANKFFTIDWPIFTSYFKENPISLFKEKEPVERN